MLQSLELFGFKSFAERTTFEFAAGITCVVGPNGSGKSNVVDGIKWILGDQSAKSLRGKEMTDVIFNGSTGRKPSSFAEASLTFDNTSGYLPLDAAQVKIGRRLYRSGDSEYLINNLVVRLKDVRDLFMGTGAGTAAYSIIEQGRVDQILQANPTTRRMVFEEAAGISRFKARKVESLRRLERVDQNLVRLTDIVDQTEARLNATRSQASKAAKFRELSTQLRAWWTGLAADDYRQAAARREVIDQLLEEQRTSLAALDARVAEFDQQLADFDTAGQTLDDQLRQCERRRSANREAIASDESSVRHHSGQDHELGTEIERLRQQRWMLHRQVTAVEQELADAVQELQELEARFSEQKQALAEREETLLDLQQNLVLAQQAMEERRTERAGLIDDQRRLSHELVMLEARREAVEESQAAAVERLERGRQSLLSVAESRQSQEAAFRQAEDDVAQAQIHLEESRQALRRLHSEHGAVEHQLALWREQRSAKLARQQLLEDLEQRREGMTLGVREILKRAAESPHAPWTLVRGCVGDLLQADLDDAPLLEVALGPRVQLLVIDDLEPLVGYLNSALARVTGRVGFIEAGPVPTANPDVPPHFESASSGTSIEHSGGEWPDLTGQSGVMCRADRLVSQSSVPGLAARLLRDTWIVETLDTARRLADDIKVPLRYVTLQGELIDADGCLFVGHAPHETAVISRKSELRQLRSDLRTFNAHISSAEQELAELDEARAEFDAEMPGRQTLLNECLAAQALCASRLAAATAEFEQLQREAFTLQQEIDGADAQQQSVAAQVEQHRESLAVQEETARQLEDVLRHDELLVSCIRDELEELDASTKARHVELAKHEGRLNALRNDQARLMRDHQARGKQRDETSLRLEAAERKRREMVRHVLQAQSVLAELYLNADEFDRRAKSLLRERDERRRSRRAIQRQQEQARSEYRTLSAEIHETQIQSRDLSHQLTTLEERLREEYQVELRDLVAAGASACSLMRQELEQETDDESPAIDAVSEGDLALQGEADEPADDAPLAAGEAVDDARSSATSDFEAWRPEIEARVERLRRRIRNLGAINTDSLQDLDELESRYTELSGQLADLQEAKAALDDIIRRINVESRRLFVETFDTIREHFRELYRKLFGGGEADIILEDPDDVLECGIDIVARPPGKELRSITLLSGGEKTLTAVALLFAMFRSKPSPYCILDEVDAALDEANVDRYKRVLVEFRDATQFIVITHRKPTMTAADVLYGVTMEQAGVSKRLTVRFDDVSDDGHFQTRSSAA